MYIYLSARFWRVNFNMNQVQLTEKMINECPFVCGNSQEVLADIETRGLQLHIGKYTKTYRFIKQCNHKRYNILIGHAPIMKLKEAREIAIQLLAKLSSGQMRHHSSMKISQAVDDYFIPYCKNAKEGYKAYLTIVNHYILPFFGKYSIKDVTSQQVQLSVYELQSSGYKAESIRKRLLVGSVLFKLLIRNDLASFNPFIGVERPKVSNIKKVSMTKDEYHAFVKVCMSMDNIHADCILLMLLTGLRVSEAISIKVSNVNIALSQLLLPKTKAGREQTQPLNSTALEILKSRSIKSWNQYVFPSLVNTDSHISAPRHCMKLIKEKMALQGHDISRITFHALRKTYATVCAEVTSGDMLMVSSLLRHSSPAIVNRYVNYQDNKISHVNNHVAEKLLPPLTKTQEKVHE